MSKRYLGGVITANPATPTGPYQFGTAPGMWTTSQQLQYAAGGVWPIAGLVPNYIENMFSTYLYTGTGAAQTITNGIDLAGKGGLVWIKSRSSAVNHTLWDTSRGVRNYLSSNNTDANTDFSGTSYGLSAFNANGFALGLSANGENSNGSSLCSWTFREQPKFFDVVTYTGNGAARTIAHNLGSVPGCIIVKCTSGADNWFVQHRSLGSTKYIALNDADIAYTNSQLWNNTDPTSTVFTLGTNSGVNANGQTYVAYLFAHDAGGFGLSGNENVISCGSFTANGSGEATVNLGYEPQWVMIKRVDGAGNWLMGDTMRGWVVGAAGSTNNDQLLVANTSDAEAGTSNLGYPTATGFFRGGAGVGWQFIYIAIRRGPMAVPTDGTTVFGVQNNASTAFKTFGFPVDWSIFSGVLSSGFNGYNQSRLTDGKYLLTYSTSAQQTTDLRFQSNTGVFDPGTYNLSFRRAPSFFDVVVSAGTGSTNQARTHNLGAVPELIIVKDRSSGAANWVVYSATLGQNFYLNLNNTNNQQASTGAWGTSAFTASTFYCLDTGTWCASIGNSGVFYLFATCPGVSKVGSYTGTGTTQAINCGFTTGARYVLIKRTDSTGDWYVWDSARGIVAGNDPYLLLNSTAAEVTNTDYVDTSTTGFEITSTAPAAINAVGGSFIFLAIS